MKDRKSSGIKVTALDVEAIANSMTKAHMSLGILQAGESYSVPSPLGFIATPYETPSKVYLIDNDGVFSPLPLSKRNCGTISLYKRRDVDGQGFSLELTPSYELEVDDILVTKLPNLGKVPLEAFIRSFGARLECNYDECANFFSKLIPAPKDYSLMDAVSLVNLYNERLKKHKSEGHLEEQNEIPLETVGLVTGKESEKAMLVQLHEMMDTMDRIYSKSPQG